MKYGCLDVFAQYVFITTNNQVSLVMTKPEYILHNQMDV